MHDEVEREAEMPPSVLLQHQQIEGGRQRSGTKQVYQEDQSDSSMYDPALQESSGSRVPQQQQHEQTSGGSRLSASGGSTSGPSNSANHPHVFLVSCIFSLASLSLCRLFARMCLNGTVRDRAYNAYKQYHADHRQGPQADFTLVPSDTI